jgi:hypothetical protein
VLWCGILERGVDPKGVDLGSVSFPRGVDLTAEFCLPCSLLVALLKPSTARVGTNPA